MYAGRRKRQRAARVPSSEPVPRSPPAAAAATAESVRDAGRRKRQRTARSPSSEPVPQSPPAAAAAAAAAAEDEDEAKSVRYETDDADSDDGCHSREGLVSYTDGLRCYRCGRLTHLDMGVCNKCDKGGKLPTYYCFSCHGRYGDPKTLSDFTACHFCSGLICVGGGCGVVPKDAAGPAMVCYDGCMRIPDANKCGMCRGVFLQKLWPCENVGWTCTGCRLSIVTTAVSEATEHISVFRIGELKALILKYYASSDDFSRPRVVESR